MGHSQDLSQSGRGDTLVELTCTIGYTIDSIISWLRNGRNVTAVSGYDQRTAVDDRFTYTFSYHLRVSDVAGYMGNITYVCMAENRYGTSSRNINFNNTGITSPYYGTLVLLFCCAVSRVEALAKPFYGNEWVLRCIAKLPPQGYMVDMELDWYGPEGETLTDNSTEFTIDVAHVENGYIQREIVFPCLTPRNDGVYTCNLQAYFEESNETLTETNGYTLHVLSE